MRSNRRRWRFLSISMCLALGAAACGDDDDDAATAATEAPTATTAASEAEPASDADAAYDELIAAAQDEGSVTVYSSQALDQLNELGAAFEDEYGISVEVVRGTDGDNIPRVETELSTNTSGADLVVTAAQLFMETHASAGDWVDPTASPQLAGLGDYDADQYIHEGNFFEVGAALLTYAWNTNEVPDGLSGFEDLLDPSLAGRVAVIDPAIAPVVVDFYLFLEENLGTEFIDGLAAQEPRIYPSALPIGEALTSGEVAAAAYAAPTQLEAAKQSGAPVDYGIADFGAWGARYFGAIPKSSDSPNAAALLADFMVTETGQSIVQVTAGSVLPNVPGTLLTNDQVRVTDVEATTPDNAAIFVEEWNSQFR